MTYEGKTETHSFRFKVEGSNIELLAEAIVKNKDIIVIQFQNLHRFNVWSIDRVAFKREIRDFLISKGDVR